MKQIFKKIIIFILKLEAQLVLWRHKPRVVAITGSVGKTSTKDAVYESLSSFFHVRKSEKSFNSEIGLPLTILGLPNAWSNPVKWFFNIIKGFIVLFKFDYPKWLVLEIGIDHPGDMQRVAKWLKTDIVVITKFSKVPVHVEFFDSPEAVMEEKSLLLKTLKYEGVAILNRDDEDVYARKSNLKRKTLSFGFNDDSDIHASKPEIMYQNDKPSGIMFRADYQGNSMPVRVNGSLGKGQIYATLAALSVGLALDLNVVSLSESLESYNPPAGRMRLLAGINNSTLIDDTYNSSPIALEAALESLSDINVKGRKIAILGDMMELGKYSSEEHEKVAEITSKHADVFMAIGVRMSAAYEKAKESGFKKGSVFKFSDSTEAGEFLVSFVKEGDVALIKGSQSIRMERVVERIMANPEDKDNLLVRQDTEWKNR